MRAFVNLSNQPFRNRRLFWLVILLLFVIPSYFGLQAIGTLTQRESELANRNQVIKKLQGERNKIQTPASANIKISTDQNRQLVAASELVARRAFSWSQLLNDIERNLPAGVRVLRVAVTQIQPEERAGAIGGAENSATLTMTVIGKGGSEVTTMINKFHESGRFKVSPISKKEIEGTEDVEFELKVEYLPPPHASRASLGNQIAEKK
jgi:Tfp pilus assembly protein PilN